MEIKNLGQFIQHLAKKAGVNEADPNLVNVLSNAELTKVPIHSELVSAIDNNLLSESTALDNHPKIKNYYHAQVLNALDKKLESILDESGLSDDKITELKAIKSTYARNEAVIAAIKDAASAASKGKATEDKSALQQQVDKLIADVKAANESKVTEIARVENLRKADKINYQLMALTGQSKTVFDEMPIEAKTAAINSVINKALLDKKATFDFDDNGVFLLKGEGDTAVLGANQTKYTPQSFIDEVLAQNKILKVSEQAQQQQGGTQTTVTAAINGLNGNNQTTSHNAATANINKRLREQATS